MLARERHAKIIALLQAKNIVRVDELCVLFSVTSETIRRDLRYLEKAKLLKRVHGGATLKLHSHLKETSFQHRYKENIEKKHVIANLAAQYINEQDIIMIDASSTAYCLCDEIIKFNDILVISNSFKALERLSFGKAKIVGTGGEFDREVSAFTGMQALASLNDFYATHCFISCYALDTYMGMMDISLAEVAIKEKMLQHSSVNYLLIDSTKFGLRGAIKINGVEHIDYFITDKKPSEEWLSFFDNVSGTLIYPTS